MDWVELMSSGMEVRVLLLLGCFLFFCLETFVIVMECWSLGHVFLFRCCLRWLWGSLGGRVTKTKVLPEKKEVLSYTRRWWLFRDNI